jgi:hypothetical protein
MSEKYLFPCIRPLNPRHFPQVGEPAHGSGCPILGDFKFRTPQNWGAGGLSVIKFATFQTSSKQGVYFMEHQLTPLSLKAMAKKLIHS